MTFLWSIGGRETIPAVFLWFSRKVRPNFAQKEGFRFFCRLHDRHNIPSNEMTSAILRHLPFCCSVIASFLWNSRYEKRIEDGQAVEEVLAKYV